MLLDTNIAVYGNTERSNKYASWKKVGKHLGKKKNHATQGSAILYISIEASLK